LQRILSPKQLAKEVRLGDRLIRNSYDSSIYNGVVVEQIFFLIFRGKFVTESGKELFLDDILGPSGLSYNTGNVRSSMRTIQKVIERQELLGFTDKKKHLIKFPLNDAATPSCRC